MNILFLTHYYPPEGNAPASRVSALAERWTAAGHEVTVVTCAPNVPDGVIYPGYTNRWCSRGKVNGVNVVRVWTYIAANRGTMLRIINYISYMFSAFWRGMLLPRPDMLIATSPQFFCGWAGVLLHWFRRLPFVLEIRDIWPESMEAVETGLPKPLLRLLERLEKIMYRASDRIVTVGDGYVEKLLERGVPKEKIDVVMNGVDKTLFHPRPPDAELLDRYGLRGKFICSYIGTIGMACGLGTALDAAEKLRAAGRDDIAILLVGDGARKAELEAEAGKRHLDNVIFTGKRSKAEIPLFIASSDVNLVHLKKTGLFTTVMPSKIFESAGCARPVIIGVDGFAKKLVMDAEAGLPMTPENSDDLVSALLRLADDRELTKTLGENAWKNIAAKYDRDVQAKCYIDILRGIIKR